jgi:cation diffusion facilitator CzcD-associated flavoprotein CzcO
MTLDPVLRDYVADPRLDDESLRAKYVRERDRRLRPDANRQYVQARAEFTSFVADPYVDSPREVGPVDDEVAVTVIGAGWGGLLAAARLRESGIERIRLVERGGDVGGVWYWNRYPGVQCDVESYVYMPLLEECDYIPKYRYAFGEEIFKHAQRIAQRFRLYDDSLFQTEVTEVRWNDSDGLWRVTTDQGDDFTSQFVVIANGALSEPKLPGIPGIDDFAGHTFHSSRWDYDYTGGDRDGGLSRLADKKVGLIGTGATAIQIVPHLGAAAERLYVFQRTPAVVGVRGNRKTDPEWAASLRPGWQRERIENFTTLVGGGDAEVDLVADAWIDLFQNITPAVARRAMRDLGVELGSEQIAELVELADLSKGEEMRARIRSIVEDPQTAAAMEPFYYLFCKRPCFHDDYLATFNRPNVSIVDTHGQGIEAVRPRAVVVEGEEYEVDCLIFATGFEVGTGYRRETGYDVVGRNGLLLSEKWADGPRTLHGMQVSGFPNCFFTGIVQNGTSINLTHVLDEQSRHIAYIVKAAADRDADVIEATPQGEAGWAEEMRRSAQDPKRWMTCTPSYLNSEGNVDDPGGLLAVRYGAGGMKFFELLKNWRAEGDLPGVELSSRRVDRLVSGPVSAEGGGPVG